MDLLNTEAWTLDALCAEPCYQDLPWFPEKGENLDKARNVCRRCLSRDACLDYAVRENIGHGVWGATSPEERKRLRRARAA